MVIVSAADVASTGTPASPATWTRIVLASSWAQPQVAWRVSARRVGATAWKTAPVPAAAADGAPGASTDRPASAAVATAHTITDRATRAGVRTVGIGRPPRGSMRHILARRAGSAGRWVAGANDGDRHRPVAQ